VLCRARGPGWSRLAVSRSELPLLIGYGLAGFFLVPTLYFVAISRLPVGIGLLFEYTAPLLVALWARFGQRQQVKSRLWIGLVASLVGLAAVAQIWRGAGGLDGVGVAAGLCSAVLLAGYYLLGARGVSQRDTLSLTCLAFGVSALVGILVLPWWRFPYAVLATKAHGIPVAALVVYLICFGSIVSYLLINAALRHLPPTSVGIIGMVEPVIASAVAWIVLGDYLDPAQLAAAYSSLSA
jgi:drug/metabolite transporter (DMT)-like permease